MKTKTRSASKVKVGVAVVLLVAGAGLAAAGFVYKSQIQTGGLVAQVYSCENSATGVKIARQAGQTPYVLTNDCRKAGYGMRYYNMQCVDGKSYQFRWQSPCEPRPQASIWSENLSSNTFTKGIDIAVNKFSISNSPFEEMALKRISLTVYSDFKPKNFKLRDATSSILSQAEPIWQVEKINGQYVGTVNFTLDYVQPQGDEGSNFQVTVLANTTEAKYSSTITTSIKGGSDLDLKGVTSNINAYYTSHFPSAQQTVVSGSGSETPQSGALTVSWSPTTPSGMGTKGIDVVMARLLFSPSATEDVILKLLQIDIAGTFVPTHWKLYNDSDLLGTAEIVKDSAGKPLYVRFTDLDYLLMANQAKLLTIKADTINAVTFDALSLSSSSESNVQSQGESSGVMIVPKVLLGSKVLSY